MEKSRVRRKFHNAIIVSTLGKSFAFPFMSRKLPQLWAKKGGIRLSDVGWGYYVVKFETISDFDRAMFGGPWMVGDHYVVIKEWIPYFQPEDSLIYTLRVWVRLPDLSLEYFDAAILKIIGDKIGKTVRLDHTTLEGSRGNFARVCVEVELSKPLLSKYRLRRRVRRVEYEGLHTICYSCGCYGHVQANCQENNGNEVGVESEVVRSNPIFQSKEMVNDRPEIDEDFGPWMKVSRSGRRGKKNVQMEAALTALDQPSSDPAVSVPAVAAPAVTVPAVSTSVESSKQESIPISGNKFAALSEEDPMGIDLGEGQGKYISDATGIEEDVIIANKENLVDVNGAAKDEVFETAKGILLDHTVAGGPHSLVGLPPSIDLDLVEKALGGKNKVKPQNKAIAKGGIKKPSPSRAKGASGRSNLIGSSAGRVHSMDSAISRVSPGTEQNGTTHNSPPLIHEPGPVGLGAQEGADQLVVLMDCSAPVGNV
ncbi:hypothetical protein LINPERHAP2_LOCUS13215 [Linum perenne]